MCEKSEQICKHTPGPWRIGKAGPNGCPTVGTERGLMVCMMAHSVNIPSHVEQARGNSRLIAAAPKLKDALAAMLDCWGGYQCPEVDAAIAIMQEIGEDRWSMQAQMDAAKAGAAA